jgi:hypothetical protein
MFHLVFYSLSVFGVMVHEDVVLNNMAEETLYLSPVQMNVVMVNVMVDKYATMVNAVDQLLVNVYLIVNREKSMVKHRVVERELSKEVHHVELMIVLNNDDDLDKNVVLD